MKQLIITLILASKLIGCGTDETLESDKAANSPAPKVSVVPSKQAVLSGLIIQNLPIQVDEDKLLIVSILSFHGKELDRLTTAIYNSGEWDSVVNIWHEHAAILLQNWLDNAPKENL